MGFPLLHGPALRAQPLRERVKQAVGGRVRRMLRR